MEEHRRHDSRWGNHVPSGWRHHTRVTAQIDWQPEGLVEKVGSALNFDDRQVNSDLDRFKEFIESRGTESGGWRGDVSADA